MTPGRNRRKRDYANARTKYDKLSRVLEDLREAATHIQDGLLEPGIDALTDKVDEAERVLRLAHAACVEAGIERAYGHHITPRWQTAFDEEADYAD